MYQQGYQRNKRRLGKQRDAKVAQIDIARRLAHAIWHRLSRGGGPLLHGSPQRVRPARIAACAGVTPIGRSAERVFLDSTRSRRHCAWLGLAWPGVAIGRGNVVVCQP
jgi:hypothetical protein